MVSMDQLYLSFVKRSWLGMTLYSVVGIAWLELFDALPTSKAPESDYISICTIGMAEIYGAGALGKLLILLPLRSL